MYTKVKTETLNELARLIHLLDGKDSKVNDIKYCLNKLIESSDAKKVEINNPRLKFSQALETRGTTELIVLHHSDASKCTINDIHNWHLANGWAGCGYHFFISKAGKVFEGRPINTIGSHCKGSNVDSLGICCEGDYTKEIFPAAQRMALIDLIKYLKTQYPKAKIKGHKELFPTQCPGKNFPLQMVKELCGEQV
jgi:N-acetyl-anhydromuramyl-L-alanine amidase AmpD